MTLYVLQLGALFAHGYSVPKTRIYVAGLYGYPLDVLMTMWPLEVDIIFLGYVEKTPKSQSESGIK